MAAPALVVHGQQNPEAMPQAGLVRLLDEDKVAFGVTIDARADLPAYGWMDPTLFPGVTPVIDLRRGGGRGI